MHGYTAKCMLRHVDILHNNNHEQMMKWLSRTHHLCQSLLQGSGSRRGLGGRAHTGACCIQIEVAAGHQNWL